MQIVMVIRQVSRNPTNVQVHAKCISKLDLKSQITDIGFENLKRVRFLEPNDTGLQIQLKNIGGGVGDIPLVLAFELTQ